jgi:hypothetical protein
MSSFKLTKGWPPAVGNRLVKVCLSSLSLKPIWGLFPSSVCAIFGFAIIIAEKSCCERMTCRGVAHVVDAECDWSAPGRRPG